MELSGRVIIGHGVIGILGKFDFPVHREFKNGYTAMLGNPDISQIEVDMRDVDYIDSAALGMLMLLSRRAHQVNKTVVLSHPSAYVSLLLEVANFERIFTIKASESVPM